MLFAHDTEVSLAAAAALVNTDDAGTREDLPDVAALDAIRPRPGAGPATRATTGPSCDAVRALRPRLRAALGARRGRAWSRSSTACCATPGPCRSWSSTTSGATTCTPRPPTRRWPPGWRSRPRWRCVDVVRSGELSRLRICDYPDCDNVVVDLSKNRSKRFCDGGCGNRAAVAAYRARKVKGAAIGAPSQSVNSSPK